MANARLTTWQKADAERLRTIFAAFKKKTGASQQKVASQLGWTQGAVSQYMCARIPLNLEALLDFVHIFKCDAKDISPMLSKKLCRWIDDAAATSLLAVEDSLIPRDFALLTKEDLHALETMAHHLIMSKRKYRNSLHYTQE